MADDPVTEIEEWREVPGHPGYEASSLGRVRSVDRVLLDKTGRQKPYRGGILKGTTTGLYRGFTLGKYKKMYLHVAVCLAFHGPRPSERHEGGHRNGNRLDNRASNLRWVTHSENEADKRRHGTNPEGRRHGMVKLTEAEVLAIREIHADTTASHQTLANQFSISRRMVGFIVNRTNWTHLP